MLDLELTSTDARLVHLSRARDRHELVQVRRSLPGSDDFTGHVVAVGTRWLVLSVLDAGASDGWVALRTGDLLDIDTAPGGRFVQRGLEFRRSWPPRAPEVPLPVGGSAESFLGAAATGFALMTLYLESDDPLACRVGRPLSAGHGLVSWQDLTCDGAWEPGPRCEAAAITRIDLGNRYHRALEHLSYLKSLVDHQGATPSS